MSRRLILPPPAKDYRQQDEQLRNRELEATIKSLIEKLSELETRIYALENP